MKNDTIIYYLCLKKKKHLQKVQGFPVLYGKSERLQKKRCSKEKERNLYKRKYKSSCLRVFWCYFTREYPWQSPILVNLQDFSL